jgi:hypothetical protein
VLRASFDRRQSNRLREINEAEAFVVILIVYRIETALEVQRVRTVDHGLGTLIAEKARWYSKTRG